MRRALVGTWLAGSALLLGCDDDNGRPNIPANPDDLIDPPVWRSHHGVLDVSLTAGPAEITVAGVTFTSAVSSTPSTSTSSTSWSHRSGASSTTPPACATSSMCRSSATASPAR